MLPSCDTFKRGHVRNVIELNLLIFFLIYIRGGTDDTWGGGGGGGYVLFSKK